MSESSSLPQQYQAFIEEIITLTLEGKIRSKDQVYTMLVERLKLGTGEIFERCLSETQSHLQLDNSSSKTKVERQLRALATLQNAWERWQKDRGEKIVLQDALEQLLSVPPEESFPTLIEILDPNQNHLLNQTQIEQLGKALQKQAELATEQSKKTNLQQLATGLDLGLKALQELEPNLMSWIYNKPQELGFEREQQQREPWRTWAKEVASPLAKQLFELKSSNQSAAALVQVQTNTNLSSWVELAVILRGLQRGLVNWFDRQPYNAKWGKQLSCSTFMIFAAIWCELSSGFNRSDRQQLTKACFQIALQLLRTFAQRSDFPLYGGVIASFSGEYLRDAFSYLDEPLRQIEGTQEKGRILTLLGYSQQMLGRSGQAITFHQEALEIARKAEDFPCEIANLNHLSRISIEQKDFNSAISYSQRALMLARQRGDRLGEAHGLANLGYSEVLAAHQQDRMDAEIYERSIEYLKEALKLSERLGDAFAQEQVLRQTQALCCNSLGIAYLILEHPQTAIEYLEKGSKAIQGIGDLYLQGLNSTYLAEAHYSLSNPEQAIYYACAAMYLLERISAREWRQSAGLLTIMANKMGGETFQMLLQGQRAKLMVAIGYDGFDHIPQLLEQYRHSV